MNISPQALRLVTECLRPHAGGPAAARRRGATRNWFPAIKLANQHLLAPAMYASLAATDNQSSIPDDVHDYLVLLHKKTHERNAILRRQALQLLQALQVAQIPVMILKGALSLFLNHYPDRGARLFNDIDVLVPFEAMPRAVTALNALGYAAETRYWPIQHAYAEFTRPNDPGAVDLHVELIDAHYILPSEEIWQRAQIQIADGVSFFTLSPTDRILHNLLHAQIHYLGNFYRGTFELRQIYDFTLLARHHKNEIDWPFIEQRFAEHRLSTALQSYVLAASRLFGLPWPLSRPASLAARVHYGRCVAQLHVAGLSLITIPWANIRGAFAWHRMNALYADKLRRPAAQKMRHAFLFLKKSTPKSILNRLFHAG